MIGWARKEGFVPTRKAVDTKSIRICVSEVSCVLKKGGKVPKKLCQHKNTRTDINSACWRRMSGVRGAIINDNSYT